MGLTNFFQPGVTKVRKLNRRQIIELPTAEKLHCLLLSPRALPVFPKADVFFSMIKGTGRHFHATNLGLKLIPSGSHLSFSSLSLTL